MCLPPVGLPALSQLSVSLTSRPYRTSRGPDTLHAITRPLAELTQCRSVEAAFVPATPKLVSWGPYLSPESQRLTPAPYLRAAVKGSAPWAAPGSASLPRPALWPPAHLSAAPTPPAVLQRPGGCLRLSLDPALLPTSNCQELVFWWLLIFSQGYIYI